MMEPRLKSGLKELSRLMIGEGEPWWIIGSAALVLSGVVSVIPDDIDVVASGECLHRLLGRMNIAAVKPRQHERFRSNPYQRIVLPGQTPIELMGNLEVDTGGGFQPLVIHGRKKVSIEGMPLFIPPVAEQIEIFRLFGRDKDLAKAALLSSRHAP